MAALAQLPKPRRLFSTWFSPPQPFIVSDPILSTISQTLTTNPQKPQTSLKKLVPSITARHVIDLTNLHFHTNTLSPNSLLSFFNFLSSQPHFTHTVGSYLAAARFLLSRRMDLEARSLLRSIVSRKGKGSAKSVFDSVIDTRGTNQQNPYQQNPYQQNPDRDFALFRDLIVVYGESGFVSDGVEVLRLVRKHKFRVPFTACRFLLEKMFETSKTETVWGFYCEVLDCGFEPNLRVLNILMHRFGREGRVGDAESVFGEIGRRGLRPSVVSFNTMISLHCRCRDVEEGFRLKKVMEEEGICPDVVTYSVLIDGLCKEGRLEDADGLFGEMCERGLVPNGVTFTTLIHGRCKNGEIGAAMEIYEQMVEKGVKLDLVAYNTLVNGLCKAGDLKGARELANGMNVRPDKITYTTLLDGYCKEGDLESAFEIRKEMVKNSIEFDNVAFTALISGLSRQGRVIDAERTLREMLKVGIKPDDAVYTMVIDGFCKKGDVKAGFRILKEMQSVGVVTYNVILNGICKLGKMKDAHKLLDAMLHSGVVPDDITYNILLEGHCRNVKPEIVDKLRSEKGQVSDFAYYTLILTESGISSENCIRG